MYEFTDMYEVVDDTELYVAFCGRVCVLGQQRHVLL